MKVKLLKKIRKRYRLVSQKNGFYTILDIKERDTVDNPVIDFRVPYFRRYVWGLIILTIGHSRFDSLLDTNKSRKIKRMRDKRYENYEKLLV